MAPEPQRGIVVGATGGIGSACARALAAPGQQVLLSGRDRTALAQLADELEGDALALPADLRSAEDRDRLVAAAAAAGPLDWLVLAAGIPLRGPLVELDAAAIRQVFDVNVVAPILLLQQLLAAPWAERGRIVVIGSVSATRPLPGRGVYGAGKAALEQMSRALAHELAPRGIRVNVVAAGAIDTPFIPAGETAREQWVRERVPLARLGSGDEVAALVRYLIRDAPDYLTGARIAIDGGTETWA